MAAVDDHDSELLAIIRLAIRALLDAFSIADVSSRDSALATLEVSFRDIIDVFGEQSAMSAVRFLELDRDEAGFRNLPEVLPADLPTVEQVHGSLEWALEPLDAENPTAARKRLGGSVQRMVLQPARETVWDATERAGTRFARVPQGAETCEWCLMLASRGAVYDEFSVLTTTGRSTSTSGRPAGLRYHDRCDCRSIEVRTDDELPEINRRLDDLWQEHSEGSFTTWQKYLAENPFSLEGGDEDAGDRPA